MREPPVTPSSELAFDRGAFASLRQFVRPPAGQVEKCEFCAASLGPRHQHLLELGKRRVVCVCDACAILFGGQTRQRYRRIPREVRRLSGFVLENQEWDSLLIPINLAFFVKVEAASPEDSASPEQASPKLQGPRAKGKTRVVAQYPSPGGVMESSLELESWDAIVERNPILQKLEPEVEALLANRIASPPQYYRAPIDQCFRLAGLLRTHWRGLSGGAEVWTEIDRFFAELKQITEEPRA